MSINKVKYASRPSIQKFYFAHRKTGLGSLLRNGTGSDLLFTNFIMSHGFFNSVKIKAIMLAKVLVFTGYNRDYCILRYLVH